MGFSKASLVSLLWLGSASAATTLPSITIKGSKFFYPNGTQFFIKGVAYQADGSSTNGETTSSSYTDPLSSKSICERDIPYLQKLGTNVIRTYAIDPTADHDDCMELLSDAGIYVISDLSSPSESIDRTDPEWNTELYSRYTSVIDALKGYNNTIGFFAGNEVTNNASTTDASAFVKAAVRDSKAYIAANADRELYVGYAADDDASIRSNVADYFNCGNQSQAVDFWGYNVYEWCGENTFEGSGYETLTDFFSNYSVPVFFAEYGCNTDGGAAGRLFEETSAIYSDNMTGVISGGIVYMYYQETNDYGLVSIISSSSVSTLKDFSSLSSRIAAATPSGVSMAAYTATNSPAACPAVGSDWASNGENLPPTPDSNLCECMFNSLSCVPSSDLNSTDYGTVFGEVCGANAKACEGITSNTTTGVYGTYLMCNSTQQLGYILDAYYKLSDKSDDACDWNGAAVTSSGSTASSCSASLASASSANAVAATATAATTGNSTDSGSGSSSSSSSFAVPMSMKNTFTIGDMAIGLYVVVAMAVGGAMVAL